MSGALREYDLVRVRKLNTPRRDYTGTESVKRAPRVGDEAVICHQYDPTNPGGTLALEKIDQYGLTVWLADFQPDELEFVSRPGPKTDRRTW